MRATTEAEWLEGTDYDSWYAEAKARALQEPPDPEPAACTCDPCETPANGAPGIAHCMACCAGTLIEAYDHECPVDDHREMAVAQFGPEPDYEAILEDRAAARGPDPEATMWGGEDIPS